MDIRVLNNNLSNNSQSAKPIKDLLNEYKEENDLSVNALANILDIDRKSVTNILTGATQDLKINHVLKIINLLNIKYKDILSICEQSLPIEENQSIEKTRKIAYLLENFDLEGLKKCGIINSLTKYDDIEQQISFFLGLNNIFEYSSLSINIPLFSQSKRTVNEKKKQKMLNFWLKCARLTFMQINNQYEYDENLLIEFIKRIRTFSTDPQNGFTTVLCVLFKLGITVIVQSYHTKTTAFGISMIVNNKPCIVITDFGKRYDKLWSTLLHELYHVINDYEYIAKANFHISDSQEQDLFVSETDADNFAFNALIGPQAFTIASKIINNPYKVDVFAQKLGIHNSLVYGQYLERLPTEKQKEAFPRYSKYLLPSEIAIKNIIYNPIDFKNLNEAVSQIRLQYRKIS